MGGALLTCLIAVDTFFTPEPGWGGLVRSGLQDALYRIAEKGRGGQPPGCCHTGSVALLIVAAGMGVVPIWSLMQLCPCLVGFLSRPQANWEGWKSRFYLEKACCTDQQCGGSTRYIHLQLPLGVRLLLSRLLKLYTRG